MPLYTEDHRKALAKVIRDRLDADLSLTFARIADASGLNDRTIRKIVDGRVDPRAGTLTALEKGLRSLGIVPSTAIVEATM